MFPLLTLGKNARLTYRGFEEPEERDVAKHASAFLFEPIKLEPDVCLKDLLALFEVCPELHHVYKRQWSREVCEQAQKGALPLDNDIEYLQLNWAWCLDTYSNTYSGMLQPQLEGVGPILTEDDEVNGGKAGSRINWSVSLTPVRELLDLPLRINEQLSLTEEDVDSHAFMREIATGEYKETTLGELIQGVLWDLSFHGGEEDKEQFLSDLKKQTEEIDAGTAELIPSDEVFEEFFNDRDKTAYIAAFEHLGPIKLYDIDKAIRTLKNDEIIGQAVERLFSGQVVIKEPYRQMNAREFRRMLRTEKSRDNASQS